MALPHSFAAVTSATGQQLDDNFAADGALTTILCTAAGANSIVLTPAANAPACTAYGLPYPYRFSFVAAGTSSGSVTVAVGALAALPLYLPTGVQAGSADLTSGFYYEAAYVASLNSGSGGFQLVSAIPTAAATGIGLASAQGLYVTNNSVTPSTKIDFTANAVVMVTSSGAPVRATSVSVTCDLTTTGVNGMDTGSRPTSGWVYLYLISNGTLTRSLASITSPTSAGPSMPVGYTYAYYAGAMYCDGSQNLLRTQQRGNRAQYKIVAATNTAAYPTMVSVSNVALTAIAVAAFVPLTAATIIGFISVTANSSSQLNFTISPNNTVTATNVALLFGTIVNTGSSFTYNTGFDVILEGANIYYSAGNSTSGTVRAVGWVDYWVK